MTAIESLKCQREKGTEDERMGDGIDKEDIRLFYILIRMLGNLASLVRGKSRLAGRIRCEQKGEGKGKPPWD